MNTLLNNFMLEKRLKTILLKLELTKEEIQLLRNVVSDVQKDTVGVSLNLKIANAILESVE